MLGTVYKGKSVDGYRISEPSDGAVARIRGALWSFATRRVSPHVVAMMLPLEGVPVAGDLVLAIIDSLGQHPGLQLPGGRRRQLFPGDEIVVAYGNRYASNQFESVVPETLGPCHLAAGGGIASRVVSAHGRMRAPTQITPVGLLGDAEGRRINLRDYALAPASCPAFFFSTQSIKYST